MIFEKKTFVFDELLHLFYFHHHLPFPLTHPIQMMQVAEPKINSISNTNLQELSSTKKKKRFRSHTTRFPTTNVSRKNGIHDQPAHSRQIHINSIHSPHKTRNTILDEKSKSLFFVFLQISLQERMKKIQKIPSRKIFSEFFRIFLTE